MIANYCIRVFALYVPLLHVLSLRFAFKQWAVYHTAAILKKPIVFDP
jgi:hypothetical protein